MSIDINGQSFVKVPTDKGCTPDNIRCHFADIRRACPSHGPLPKRLLCSNGGNPVVFILRNKFLDLRLKGEL